jgi:two-component system sensor histidine kinase AtoS
MEVLSQELNLDQEDKEVFLQVINEIDRINSLLKNLLNYARPSKPDTVLFDVHQVLDMSIKSAQYSMRTLAEDEQKNIEFVRDYNSEVPKIVADPGQLQQVFLNLLLNSVDAIADQGKITVQTIKSSNKNILVTISDNGKGIDSQALDKIFKPFFTTKSHGTGLGLAICKRLIEQHIGGAISAAHNPEGAGVTFTITLPMQQEREVTAQ